MTKSKENSGVLVIDSGFTFLPENIRHLAVSKFNESKVDSSTIKKESNKDDVEDIFIPHHSSVFDDPDEYVSDLFDTLRFDD